MDDLTMPCTTALVWVRSHPLGEADRVVAPHLSGCVACRRIAARVRSVTSWVLGRGPECAGVVVAALAGHAAARFSP